MEHLGFVLSDGISQEDARAFQITAVPASPNPPLIKAYLTAVSQLSPGVLVACGAACVRAEQGDAAGATRLLVAAMNICRQMDETPMLIAKRETWRRFGLALRTTERLLRDHPDLFNAKQLRELEQSYASYDGFGLPLEVDGGRVVIDSIRRMADPNGGVSTRLQGVSVAIARAGGKVASLRQEAEFLDDLLRRSAVEYARPIHQRTSWSAHDDLRAKQGTSPMYVSVLMFPAVEFIYHTREFIWQHRDGMLAVLAIHRYRLENKSWPESLEQTGTVPIDRFSGKSLIYRRQDSGFLLYSVGPNGQDDDGAPESWDSLDQLVQVFATSPKLARNSSGDWRFWSSE